MEQEEALAVDHEETLSTVSEVGSATFMRKASSRRERQPFYRRAFFAGCERVLGGEHCNTLQWV